ncbi:hypothetical protein ACHQM5_020097 [Ranunculus cassubicifolius]
MKFLGLVLVLLLVTPLTGYRNPKFPRKLQEDDNGLIQPDGGNWRGASAGNHHVIDLQAWDKQHPKPSP